MFHSHRARAILVLAVSLAVASSTAAAARTLIIRDQGYLSYQTSYGSAIVDEGHVRGTLPGRARVRFDYNGSPTVRASFTITGLGFTLSGTANCRLSNPNSTAPSFRGSVVLTGGRGRYARMNGRGELFGVFYRRSYGLTVQASGTARY